MVKLSGSPPRQKKIKTEGVPTNIFEKTCSTSIYKGKNVTTEAKSTVVVRIEVQCRQHFFTFFAKLSAHNFGFPVPGPQPTLFSRVSPPNLFFLPCVFGRDVGWVLIVGVLGLGFSRRKGVRQSEFLIVWVLG